MPKRAFDQRHPYRFVTLVELMIIGVYLVAGTVEDVAHVGGLGIYVLANVTLTVLLAVILTVSASWRRVGFRRGTGRQLLWVLPMALPAVLNLYPGLDPGGLSAVLGFLCLALMVGFVEESAFRGLMLRALEPLGEWRAVIVTTVLFGVTHLLNILAGEGGLQAVMQLLYAAAIGFAFAALALRTRLIWPLVLVHALIDFVAFMRDPALTVPPAVEITVDLAVTIVFVAYGLFVMLRRDLGTTYIDATVRTSPQVTPEEDGLVLE